MFDGYTRPPRYRALRAAISELKAEHSERLRLFFAGRSCSGRRIPALGFGELRGAALLVGGVHGSEWLCTLLLMRFAEHLLREGIRPSGLIILPCLNPDGAEIALCGPAAAGRRAAFIERIWRDRSQCWQANINGVDINHNFDAGWQELRRLERLAGVFGPGPTRYGGPAPFSEPESRAAANICVSFGVRSVYAFHSQGEEIYWRYGERTPPNARELALRLGESCGYAVCDPGGTASHGGLKDWFIRTTGRPGFTIEAGRGKNPLPLSDLPELWERLRPTLELTLTL